MQQLSTRIRTFLGSRRFLWLVVGFFVFEACWIAFSAVYPQAFDEDFHFGLIRIYAHHWLPFLASQPAHANAYGAVARDPSYLYHYLMSFPYRLIVLFVHGQVGQVIALRLINIGLFTSGLLVFRRVLLRTGISQALINLSILLFALIPIVPQLAAQINYDNLLIPLVGAVCLLAFRASDEWAAHRPAARTLLTLLGVSLLACLVKYEFVPIFAAEGLFLGLLYRQHFRRHFRAWWTALRTSWQQESRLLRTGLLTLVVVSVGLVGQRDGVNLIKYHTIAPDCSLVLSINDCSAYSVWIHDYTSHQQVLSHTAQASSNPVAYFGEWTYWLWYRLFFAVNGPASSFTNYPPLPLPSLAFILIGFGTVAATLTWRRRIFKNNSYLIFLALIIILYLSALLTEGYLKYRYTAVLELMNGRYLVPILLPMAAIASKAFSAALRKTPQLKSGLAVVALLCFLGGGGFLTFIARSDSSWDWSNGAVVKLNDAARQLTDPVLVNGRKTYTTSEWFFN